MFLIILCASNRGDAENLPCFYAKPSGLLPEDVARLRHTSQTYGPHMTQDFLGRIRGQNPRALRRILTEAKSPEDIHRFSRFLGDLPPKSQRKVLRMLEKNPLSRVRKLYQSCY